MKTSMFVLLALAVSLLVADLPAAEHKPPFELTAEQQAEVDRVLAQWEQADAKVKTFECRFVRWRHDLVFDGPNKENRCKACGVLKYEAPDKGVLRVLEMEKDGQMVEADAVNAEHYVCHEKSVYLHEYVAKRLSEFQLPHDSRGKFLSEGPIPFPVATTARNMKKHYHIRVVEPPEDVKDQIWLEAYPRDSRAAYLFSRVEFILDSRNMRVTAIQFSSSDGKTRMAYSLYDIKVNAPDSLTDILGPKPFVVETPPGWKKTIFSEHGIVEEEDTPADDESR